MSSRHFKTAAFPGNRFLVLWFTRNHNRSSFITPEGLIATVTTTLETGNSITVTVSFSIHSLGMESLCIQQGSGQEQSLQAQPCVPFSTAPAPSSCTAPSSAGPNLGTHRQGTAFKKKKTKLKSSSQITRSYAPSSLLRGAFFSLCYTNTSAGNNKVGNTQLTVGPSTWNCEGQCNDDLTAHQGLELGRTSTSATHRIVWHNEIKNSPQVQEGAI